MSALINPQPRLLSSADVEPDSPPPLPSASQDALRDELFSLVRRIHDPEHPHTLEELGVVSKRHIRFHSAADSQHDHCEHRVSDDGSNDDSEHEAVIELTPTVPHCSLATTIGLCVRHKVESAMPDIKLTVRIRDGTHRTAAESQPRHTLPPHGNSSATIATGRSECQVSPLALTCLHVSLLGCACVVRRCFLCCHRQVSKQLNDKERCCAAMENRAIADIVMQLTRDTPE